jgi:hypothetical protein
VLRRLNLFQYFLPCCLLGLVLIGLGGHLWLIFNFGTPVPDAAQWRAGIAELVPAWADGNITLGPASAPHSFPLLARAVLGALVHANHQWDDRIATVVTALLLAGTVALLLAAVARRIGWTALWASALSGSVLLALPIGWEQSLLGSALPDRLALFLAFPAAWVLLDRNLTSPLWWLAALSLLLAQAAADWTAMVCLALGAVAAVRACTTRTRRPRDLAVIGLAVLALGVNQIFNYDRWSALGWPSFQHISAAIGDPWPGLTLILLLPLGFRLLLGLRDTDRKHSLAPIVTFIAAAAATIGWMLAEHAPRTWGAISAVQDVLLLLLLLGFVMLTQLWHFRWQRPRTRIAFTAIWTILLLVSVHYRLNEAVGRELPTLADLHDRELVAFQRALSLKTDETALNPLDSQGLQQPDIGYASAHLAAPALRGVLPFVLQPSIAIAAGPATTADFVPLRRDRFSLPTPADPAWAGGPTDQVEGSTVFISLPLPPSKTRVLRFRTAGDLGTPRFPFTLRSTHTGEIVPLELDTSTGERWRTANLVRPDDPVVIVAGPASLGTWGAFTQPVEMGLCSWYAAKLAKNWILFLLAGTGAFAVALLLPLTPRSISRKTFELDAHGQIRVATEDEF